MTFNPLTAPQDYIVLAGQRSPGIARLEGAHTPREFIDRRGFGVSFGWTRFRGCPLPSFKCFITLTTEEDWDAWHEWKPLLARPTEPADQRPDQIFPRLNAPPLEIEHPILADLGITSVVIEDVIQPIESRPGEWTIEIHLKEHRERPVVALERTEGSRVVESNGDRAISAQMAAAQEEIRRYESPEGLAST